VLVAAFLAWMFAGLEISLFILIHRQMMISLLGTGVGEEVVTRWFAWYQAAFLFGAAAGGWVFGWLGDRAGRTRAMGLSVLCYSLFTLACYPADTPELLLVLRFLACLGIGGVWPNAVALVAEAWPAASRPFLAGLLGTAANVGFVLLGIIGYYVEITFDAWRWVLLVGAAPAVLGVFILAGVPESARWVAARSAPAAAGGESPLREVLRPPLLSRTVLGVMLGAIPVVGTAANANWLVPWTDHVASERAAETGAGPRKPADARSKAKTQITRSSGAMLGSLLGGVVASLLGRRLTYFLISLGALAVSSYIFTQLDPLHAQFHVFTFLLGFVGVTYFGWLPLFLPELFPTRVRSTGTGISFNTGRVVAAVVVLSAGFILGWVEGDYAAVGFWSGMIYAVGMVIIWFAPRGASGKLED
jgi:MFS family permease